MAAAVVVVAVAVVGEVAGVVDGAGAVAVDEVEAVGVAVDEVGVGAVAVDEVGAVAVVVAVAVAVAVAGTVALIYGRSCCLVLPRLLLGDSGMELAGAAYRAGERDGVTRRALRESWTHSPE